MNASASATCPVERERELRGRSPCGGSPRSQRLGRSVPPPGGGRWHRGGQSGWLCAASPILTRSARWSAEGSAPPMQADAASFRLAGAPIGGSARLMRRPFGHYDTNVIVRAGAQAGFAGPATIDGEGIESGRFSVVCCSPGNVRRRKGRSTSVSCHPCKSAHRRTKEPRLGAGALSL